MRLPAALAGLLVVSAAAGQEVPTLSGRVVDEAGLLNDAERRGLESMLARIEAETTVQIALLSVPRLETPIEDFAIRVAEAWGIGQAETDNGALVVVSVEDRASRIETGYGLEAVLPDGLAGRILREELAPSFQAGDYATGFERTALRIAAVATGAFPAEEGRRAERTPARRGRGGMLLFLLLVGVQALGFLGNAFRPWVAGLAGAGVAALFGLLAASAFALLWLVPAGLLAGFAATGMTRAASNRRSASWGYGGMMMGRSSFGSGFGGLGGFGGGGASGRW